MDSWLQRYLVAHCSALTRCVSMSSVAASVSAVEKAWLVHSVCVFASRVCEYASCCCCYYYYYLVALFDQFQETKIICFIFTPSHLKPYYADTTCCMVINLFSRLFTYSLTQSNSIDYSVIQSINQSFNRLFSHSIVIQSINQSRLH